MFQSLDENHIAFVTVAVENPDGIDVTAWRSVYRFDPVVVDARFTIHQN